MNTKREHWVQEVEKSLEGIERAEAPPFLFTRIEARLQATRQSVLTVSVPVLRWAVVSACVLVTLNVAVLLNSNATTETTAVGESGSIYAEGGVNYQLY